MKILLYIEPVVFWETPAMLEAHLFWAHQIAAVLTEEDELSVASSPQICRTWLEIGGTHVGRRFEIDPFLPLKDFGWSRDSYASALYTGAHSRFLKDRLAAVRAEFAPDLVIATSQSSAFKSAFEGTVQYHIEQAPLPRYRQPFRTAFDPDGHQVGSMLGRKDAIVSRAAPDEALAQAAKIISAWAASLATCQAGLDAQAHLEPLRSRGKIAILATQPPGWSTYEGAYRPLELSGLLCEWADQLPPGWIGVPTFHERGQISPDLQQAIAVSNPRLSFLPENLSTGMSEPLVAHADAVVSISSTTSVTALLLGKPAITVGACALDRWTGRTLASLSSDSVDEHDATRLFMFLTHEFALTADQMTGDPGRFRRKLERHAFGETPDVELEIERWNPEISGNHLIPIDQTQ